MKIDIQQAQLARELDELGAISALPAPATTRVVFTEIDLAGRAFVKRLAANAGLSIREDAVGNTFLRWEGREPGLPAVATGSHIDAIPNAGRFDGTVGVLGGLEAIRALQRAGFQPRRSIEVILFTSEEPTRFGIGCLGSRLMAGTLSPSCDDSLQGKDGVTLREARTGAGFSGDLASVRLTPGRYAAFAELHIEQGPLLERDGIQAGVVTAIAAPATLRVTFEGEGGHAGAVLMPGRRDALLAAAEAALAVERAVLATGSRDTVGTTGVCDVFPGAVNSIPSRVRLEIDVRDIDGTRRDGVLASIHEAIAAITTRRKIGVSVETLNADPPATCAPEVIGALEASCVEFGVGYQKMISRAYHDSLFMSRSHPRRWCSSPAAAG